MQATARAVSYRLVEGGTSSCALHRLPAAPFGPLQLFADAHTHHFHKACVKGLQHSTTVKWELGAATILGTLEVRKLGTS